jgi:hypothetical protein
MNGPRKLESPDAMKEVRSHSSGPFHSIWGTDSPLLRAELVSVRVRGLYAGLVRKGITAFKLDRIELAYDSGR